MKLHKPIISILHSLGLDLKRYPSRDIRRRMLLLKNFEIDTVIDVGANEGGYANELRRHGFKGKIISVEPLPKVFSKLEKRASKDTNWQALNLAVGNENKLTTINIAANSFSSSILNMKPLHLETAPYSQYIGKVEIEMKTLDSLRPEILTGLEIVYLKLDAQGFEEKILKGANSLLQLVKGIQLELSMEGLYEGGTLYLEMIQFLKNKGFDLYSLENGFYDPKTGQLLQADGIFYRRS